MFFAELLSWSGVGLWILSSPVTAARVFPVVPSLRALGAARALGVTLVALSAWPLAREMGPALAVPGTLLVLMSALSAAVVLAALRPRWLLASVPVSVGIALALPFFG